MKKVIVSAWLDKSDPDKPVLRHREEKTFRLGLKEFQEGEMMIIEVYKHYTQRTDGQNRFYHKIFLQEQIECFKEQWGETYSKGEMHDWNKRHFWGEERLVEATGEYVMTPASSADQNTVEWEEKLDKIRQWFILSFEWFLPFPDSQKAIRFK